MLEGCMEVTAQARQGVCYGGPHLVHTHKSFWVGIQFWSLKSVYFLCKIVHCCTGVREVKSWSLPCFFLVQHHPFCGFTGFLGLFIPYFKASLSLLLMIHWNRVVFIYLGLLNLAAFGLVFLVLSLGVTCNMLLPLSISLWQTGPHQLLPIRFLQQFKPFLFIYCKIRGAQMALLPCTPASPALAAHWYCSWLTRTLWLLKLLGGHVEPLLLSCLMTDGVLETGQEQVLLLFAVLLLHGRHLSACLSRICWHHNEDLMIRHSFVTSSFFCIEWSFLTGCWRELRALKMTEFGDSCRKFTCLPHM